MKQFVVFLSACVGCAVIGAASMRASIEIAHAAPTVPMCEAINQAGAITVYLCEPDNGPPYLVNSVGFMMEME